MAKNDDAVFMTEEDYYNGLAEEEAERQREEDEQLKAEEALSPEEVDALFDTDNEKDYTAGYRDVCDSEAFKNMSDYMVRHNYEKGDASIYRNDPEWQKLNDALEREIDREKCDSKYWERDNMNEFDSEKHKVGSNLKAKKSTDYVGKINKGVHNLKSADNKFTDNENKFNPDDFDQ